VNWLSLCNITVLQYLQFIIHVFTLHLIPSVSQSSVSQPMPYLSILCQNCSLVSSTALGIIAAKFNCHTVFSLACNYAAKVCSFMVSYDVCLFLHNLYNKVIYERNIGKYRRFPDRFTPWEFNSGAENLFLAGPAIS
jgi:hypothetical protein